jgi:hypothetical protein
MEYLSPHIIMPRCVRRAQRFSARNTRRSTLQTPQGLDATHGDELFSRQTRVHWHKLRSAKSSKILAMPGCTVSRRVWERETGKMAKTKKTARELAAMVMREVRASGKCSDLQNVVVHPTGRNYPTWECATQVNKPGDPNYQLSAACRHTLDLIVGRLQSIYDLAG